MALPRSNAGSRSNEFTTDSLATGVVDHGTWALTIEGDGGLEREYELRFDGDVAVSDCFSAPEEEPSVSVLADDTTVVTGTLGAEPVDVAVEGTILAGEFERPAPTVTLDGEPVDVETWPTPREYADGFPWQEPVEDPFENRGQLSKPPGDPLDPQEYVISLDGADLEGAREYAFDVDGAVLDHPETATTGDDGRTVSGRLAPEESVELVVRGVVSWIEADATMDISVESRD